MPKRPYFNQCISRRAAGEKRNGKGNTLLQKQQLKSQLAIILKPKRNMPVEGASLGVWLEIKRCGLLCSLTSCGKAGLWSRGALRGRMGIFMQRVSVDLLKDSRQLCKSGPVFRSGRKELGQSSRFFEIFKSMDCSTSIVMPHASLYCAAMVNGGKGQAGFHLGLFCLGRRIP